MVKTFFCFLSCKHIATVVKPTKTSSKQPRLSCCFWAFQFLRCSKSIDWEWCGYALESVHMMLWSRVLSSSFILTFFALKLCSISFVIIAGWRLRLVTFVYWLISSLKAYTWVTSVNYFETALMLFSSPMERSVQLATPTTGIQTSPNCRKLMINRPLT